MRYFLYLSYKGTQYHGWQIQKNALGIQQVINEALETILRVSINTMGSGRTDTGVHANEQVLHFDFNEELNEGDFVYKLNSLLPKDIAAKSLKRVVAEAHARFGATERQYIYQITRNKNPFGPDLAYFFRKDLDLEQMNSLSGFIVSHDDFQSFSKVKTDVNNFICDVQEVSWAKVDNNLFFKVRANRFLRGMVRALVGTMMEVGMGNISKGEFEAVVESRDRRKAGTSVPAHGLFLDRITYPNEIFLDQ